MMKNYPHLDAVLREIRSRWGIPGLAVGIVEAGQCTYAKGFGVQSLDTGVPVTPESLFCLASIAKCFVACAVMQLVEAGRLKLDTPIVEYLPEFCLVGKTYPHITIRQMLSHTSGMPDMDEIEYDALVYHPEVDEGAPGRFISTLSTRKMIGLPGERFAYSNIAYNVLGVLISRVSGASFETTMKENILNPSGMQDSTFFFSEVPLDHLAMPHLRIPGIIVNPILPYHRADAPSSFLYSNVIEMCRWAITSLNRGIYREQRILSSTSYDLMWSPVAQRGYPPLREEMGLGWALGHFEGVRTVAHGGGGFGWTCHLILLPDKNSGAIILSNEESSAIEALEQAVMRAVLGLAQQAGHVSWMIPVAQALQSGGIQAAYACYEDIIGVPDYFIDPYDLVTLVYQLYSAKKFELAQDVLKLNLHAFPGDRSTKAMLEKLSSFKDTQA